MWPLAYYLDVFLEGEFEDVQSCSLRAGVPRVRGGGVRAVHPGAGATGALRRTAAAAGPMRKPAGPVPVRAAARL